MNDIVIKDMSFAYDLEDDELKEEEENKLILADINLEVKSGEFVCILGKSGCGKSTLLRLLAGLEHPSAGSIYVDGEEIKGASLDRGVVFQDYGLFPWMTAGENIQLALEQKYPKKSKKELKEIVEKSLKEVGLEPAVAKKLPKELSGGMQQRCSIAQVFSIDPPILLMDEPFGALDAVTRARLQELVLNLWEADTERKTVFFVTHDVDEALLLANRIIVLGQSPGSVIFDQKLSKESMVNKQDYLKDPKMMDLRNTLIHKINEDVAQRI